MLQTEFEERVGKRVTPETYAAIERVYTTCPTIDKDRFCREWKEKKLDNCHIVADLTDIANHLELEKQQWQHTAEQEAEIKHHRIAELQTVIIAQRELAEELDQLRAEHVNLAKALVRGGLEEEAEKILGRAKVIAIKAIEKIEFSQADLDFIAETFNK